MEALQLFEQDRTQDVISRAKRYMTAQGMRIPELAGKLNNPNKPGETMNRSTLHQILNNQYSSNTVDKYIDELERFLNEQAGETAGQLSFCLPAKPDFIATQDALAILGLCRDCQENSQIGVITGKSGYGKTHTLRQYAKKPKVIFIPCGVNTRARDILRIIENTLFLPKIYGTIQERVEHVAEFFRAHPGYLIVLDEADKIFGKNTTRPLDTMRDIYDAAVVEDASRVGVVITGELVLETQLKSLMERFANRAGLHYRLDGLTKEEVSEYLKDFQLSEDARNELVYRASNKQNGCFRLLDRTIRNIIRLLEQRNQTDIDLQTIRDASAMLMF